MKKKITAIALASVIAATGLSAVSAGASAEWVKSGSSYSYKDDATGKKLTGWQTIDGGKYYFGKDGKALTGWYKIGGEKYYFNASKKGRMVTSWIKIGDDHYYFGADGVLRTGWVKLDGKTYYLGNDGAMRTGTVKLDGKTYTFGSDGVLKSTVKTKSPVKTGTVSWNDSMADIEEMLEAKGTEYVTLNTAILAGDFENMDVVYYVFDDDGALGIYGTMVPGSDIDAASAKIKAAGYSYYRKESAGSTYVYFYKNRVGNLAFATSYLSDGNYFTMAMYCSPDISSDIRSGDTSSFMDILSNLS